MIYFLIGELIERGVGEGEVEREEMRQGECNRSCRFEYIFELKTRKQNTRTFQLLTKNRKYLEKVIETTKLKGLAAESKWPN